MTLSQALAIVESRKQGADVKLHFLVCGFEPLHLAPLFQAHLLERLPHSKVEVQTGIYGDLRGNVNLAASSSAIAAAVAMEWSDIDPRLGLRSAGGWGEESLADIPVNTLQMFSQLERSLVGLAARMPVAFCGPSLPLPPLGHTIGEQAAVIELELEQQLAAFRLRLARVPGLRIVQPSAIGAPLPLAVRLDPKMELLAGFPYTVPFADALAVALAHVLWQQNPKKGLITDLDDTLWAGLVGELGVDGVSWQQESHSQVHGLYQQMLGRLAACGVFIGVASKNEMSTVAAALARKDFFLKAKSLFPVAANWGPKSASVANILSTWNIGADSVVFVDDSPMELEEVRRAFPGITCLRFEPKDPAKVWTLFGELRNLFGKPLLTEEDSLRLASVRASAHLLANAEDSVSADFLKGLEGTLTFQWEVDAADKRPLELINKTNQFNLNGHRISEGDWLRMLEEPDKVIGVVSYQDKFGPLGRIGVLVGSASGTSIRVLHWVMSCRAFSRMLEHHTIQALFARSNAEEIDFAFEGTDRNQPLQAFFKTAGIRPDASGAYRLSRTSSPQCAALPHRVANIPERTSEIKE